MPQSKAAASVADSVHDLVLSHIGFGSCNNQLKGPQSELFARLKREQFDLWVWMGDVVYTKGFGMKDLTLAYEQLKADGSYHSFAQSLPQVVGTWDDHDLGVNDGGTKVTDLEKRQELFHNFLNLDKHSPRRTRKGVYASHDFGSGDQIVRVILLDTRSGRSDYPLAAIGAIGGGSWYGKLFPLFAAASRSTFALTGATKLLEDYGVTEGKMLDETQWKWLETQLTQSPAKVNILVSSVQVLTRNPSVESWGHFPRERLRLLNLINRTKPSGFLVVSGDVHIGIPMTPFPEFPLLEATSSGLTHTCTAGGIPETVCTFVWNLFETRERVQSMILDRNFGRIDVDWESQTFTVKIKSLMDDQEASYQRTFGALPDFDPERIPSIIPEHHEAFLGLFLVGALIAPVILIRIIRILFRRK